MICSCVDCYAGEQLDVLGDDVHENELVSGCGELFMWRSSGCSSQTLHQRCDQLVFGGHADPQQYDL